MKLREITDAIERLRPFYHSIRLVADDGESLYTPGEPYFDVWNNIRTKRAQIDYTGKLVLDLATFDGLWAFEAEQKGAALVMATDCNWEAHERFLFCRTVLKSNVIPLFNIPAHELAKRLDFYLQGHAVDWAAHDPRNPDRKKSGDPKFDIVQNLGLIYHLRDPMLSLLQCRSVMKDGAVLLLETAFIQNEDEPVMIFNGSGQWRVYDDKTTWWAPSRSCLEEMLISSCFEPFGEPSIYDTGNEIGRICLTARATPFEQVDPRLMSELRNTYRTPGLEI